jgi:thioester reductase-like protein
LLIPYKGTLFLLRLAHAGRPKTLAFTSSISTCLASLPGSTIPEAPISPNPSVALNTGYAQSKYIIERLLLFAATHLHLPIRLLRVGQLCGHTQTGHWNTDEMWPILFATSAKLGAVPDLKWKRVDWVPVDVAARAICEIVLHSQASRPSSIANGELNTGRLVPGASATGGDYTVHNIVSPTHTPWSTILSLLQSNPLLTPHPTTQLQKLSMREWVALLNKAASSGASADELPGLRLLGFFEDMARRMKAGTKRGGEEEEGIIFETKGSEEISAALRACGGYKREWFEKSVRKWKEDGFI